MARSVAKKKGSVETTPKSNTLLSFFRKSDDRVPKVGVKVETEDSPSRRKNQSRKGKGRDEDVYGSIGDPVVISDDDEPICVQPDVSLKQTSKSPLIVGEGASRDTESGPSKVSPRSPSPPTYRDRGQSRDISPIEHNPFPNIPGFKPPPTWPAVVNTASNETDEADIFFDDNKDGSVIALSDDEEDEEPVVIEEQDANIAQSEKDEIEVLDDSVRKSGNLSRGGHVPLHIPPIAPDMQTSSQFADDFEPGLEWDEPEDEGMGMEEEDEEASDIIATPPPVNLKRKRGTGGDQSKVECPICGLSLKGKQDTAVSEHINSCLDTPSSSRAPRSSRPISSFANTFSPAGSPSPPPEEPIKGPNAFSVLMSGHKEKQQWKDAEIDLRRDGKRHFGRRKAPFYKVMTGMPVAVDAFRYGAIPKVTAYLLTHAHSDHYTNLSKSWKEGPIYCSKTTANLIVHMLGVEPQWVHGLPDNIPFEMPNTGGVTVTPIEANHCPGSSIFLFEGPQTVNAGDSPIRSPYVGSKRTFRYLHCGDFRACPKMILHPAIARAKIDTCYLDTTYLNPKYCFPPQPQVIEACALLARKTALGISDTAPPMDDTKPDVKVDLRFDAKPDINAIKEEDEEKSKMMMQGWLAKKEDEEKPDIKPEIGEHGEVKLEIGDDPLREVKAKPKGRTLIVMGTYSIGKERIVKAVAKALGTKIYCDPRKRGILLCQTDPDLHSLLSNDPIESQVHLLPLGNIQLDRLQPYLAHLHPHFDRVLGFRPTGWAYSPPAGTDMLPDVNMVIRRDQSRTFSHASLKPMRGSCRQFMMYGVPYSEHSSFFELTCFALSVPGPDVKMIATVNVGNEKSRAKMKKWFEKWAAEKAKRREKGLPAIVDYRDETYW